MAQRHGTVASRVHVDLEVTEVCRRDKQADRHRDCDRKQVAAGGANIYQNDREGQTDSDE